MAVPEALEAVHEGTMCDSVRVKLRLQWKLQEVRDARNAEHLQREATGSKFKGLAIRNAASKAIRTGLSNLLEAHITLAVYP